jgi:glycosyltransferase involved in cell wall biosynthesis
MNKLKEQAGVSEVLGNNINPSDGLKISIVVPVYNTAAYLRRCLDSVVGQTLRDIEIVCVNDASTDGSLEILNEYAAKDKRIRIINKSKSEGQGVARNQAIEAANGEYIGFVDSDDWIELNYFEELYNASQPTNADIVFNPNLNKCYEDGKSELTSSLKVSGSGTVHDLKQSMMAGVWRKIVKKEYIRKNNIHFYTARCGEDYLFYLLSVFYTDNIAYTDKTVYNWFRHGKATAMQPFSGSTEYFDAIIQARKILKTVKCSAADRKFYNQLCDMKLEGAYRYLCEAGRNKQDFKVINAAFFKEAPVTYIKYFFKHRLPNFFKNKILTRKEI